LSDHPSFFGHLTAFAEIAIGLGLLVGLLTRAAALGGMVLVTMIVLSIDWGGVKQYTGSSGWFTSVDLAVGVALSVFLLGGADPFSLDALFWRARVRRRLADDDEPGFRDNEFAESRARLQGRPYDESEQAYQNSYRTESYPTEAYPAQDRRNESYGGSYRDERSGDHPTERLPVSDEDTLWNDGRGSDGRGSDGRGTGGETSRIDPVRTENRDRR